METKNLIIFVVLSFLILAFFGPQPDKPNDDISNDTNVVEDKSLPSDIKNKEISTGFSLDKSNYVQVETDMYKASISKEGGDIRNLYLKKYIVDFLNNIDALAEKKIISKNTNTRLIKIGLQ